jgi:hypothetical protein
MGDDRGAASGGYGAYSEVSDMATSGQPRKFTSTVIALFIQMAGYQPDFPHRRVDGDFMGGAGR